MILKEKEISFPVSDNRQAYLVQIEGTAKINGITLNQKDAMEEIADEDISIRADETSHFIVIEMGKAVED